MIEEMLDVYGDMVYRVALTHTQTREDAEDAAQEAFVIYARRRPEFAGAEHAKAWFLRVTMRCCGKIRNSAHRRRSVSLSGWEDSAAGASGSGPPVSDVRLALLSLKPEYRAPVYLFYYEDMSVRGVADVLQLSETAVKKRLERARAQLRDILGGDLDDPS